MLSFNETRISVNYGNPQIKKKHRISTQVTFIETRLKITETATWKTYSILRYMLKIETRDFLWNYGNPQINEKQTLNINIYGEIQRNTDSGNYGNP
jgi:hypothetical protein